MKEKLALQSSQFKYEWLWHSSIIHISVEGLKVEVLVDVLVEKEEIAIIQYTFFGGERELEVTFQSQQDKNKWVH